MVEAKYLVARDITSTAIGLPRQTAQFGRRRGQVVHLLDVRAHGDGLVEVDVTVADVLDRDRVLERIAAGDGLGAAVVLGQLEVDRLVVVEEGQVTMDGPKAEILKALQQRSSNAA